MPVSDEGQRNGLAEPGARTGHRSATLRPAREQLEQMRRDSRCVTAGVPGLEPRTTEPESAVLPITPYPNGQDRNPGRLSTLAYWEGAAKTGRGAPANRARRSRFTVEATVAPAPAATINCCGPGGT